MDKLQFAIVLCTTRENRSSDQVGDWVLDEARKLNNHNYEIVDLKDYPMSFFGDNDSVEIAKKFNDRLRIFDGYIFVLAEYNHSIPGVLKSALDWVNDSIANKAAAIVSYGAVGGARAAEHLRSILGQLQVADISRQTLFSIFNDFEPQKHFKPQKLQYELFAEMIEQLELWTKAFKSIRN